MSNTPRVEAVIAAFKDFGQERLAIELIGLARQLERQCGPASTDMESMRVSLGCCLALMAQSGNPGCEEMARRIPFTIKNGEPYALVGLDATGGGR